MTVVIAWYRKTFGTLWVAADTRISGRQENQILTDHGPKIFQIPVVCRKLLSRGKTSRIYRTSYGFAFAGSSISAFGTHAIASACCQNLASFKKPKPPSVEDVAKLYRKIAELQIREMCSRVQPTEWRSSFFWGFVFGHCLLTKSYRLWVIEAHLLNNNFSVTAGELPTNPGVYYPIGSGKDEFNEMVDKEAATGSNNGVYYVLQKMVEAEIEPTVGGHLQLGIATPSGVELRPILVPTGRATANTTFLGVAADTLGSVGDFEIGYHAIGPDERELIELAKQWE